MENYEKKYKEALERAKDLHDNHALGMPFVYETCEDIFPELRESEDEKTRKGLINMLSQDYELHKKEIAWFEKQDETSTEDFGEFINGLSKQFPEVSFAKLSRIAVRIKNHLEKKNSKVDVLDDFPTEFERQVSHLISSSINKEWDYTESFVKYTANALLQYAKNGLKKQGENELEKYINDERNKKDFYCEGKEMSWNEMPLDVKKHDYPYYFKGNLDCYPFNVEKQGEKPIEQDTEIRDLWVYIREWNDKFGRLPNDEDELASCIDYVMKRQKPVDLNTISIQKLVDVYRNKDEYDKDGNLIGKPVNCMVRAYEQGIRDILKAIKRNNYGTI